MGEIPLGQYIVKSKKNPVLSKLGPLLFSDLCLEQRVSGHSTRCELMLQSDRFHVLWAQKMITQVYTEIKVCS